MDHEAEARREGRNEHSQRQSPPPQPRCPQCHSADKSLSQPRYFCKSCRKHWTEGRALKDLGGSRKVLQPLRSSSSNHTLQPQPPPQASTTTLDMHVLDYMIGRGTQKTAKVFRDEAAVCDDPIGANRGPIVSPPYELLPKVGDRNLRPTSILEELNSQKPQYLHFLGEKVRFFSSRDISPDGNLVASAGFDQAAYIWHMDASDIITIPQAHENIITDLRFNPCSSNVAIFATSSSDQTARVWDAATGNNSMTLAGHATPVKSLDFHPTNGETLCSSTVNGIQLWNFNPSVCLGMLQGGGEQIRFQTPPGKLLAVATGNNINVVDVGTWVILYSLKGHIKNIQCLCWDLSGNYIASVSEDSARVWSIKFGGQCIHELQSNGQMFQTCIFNPKYPNQLVIGGNQILLSWVPENGQTLIIPAHDRLIIALAASTRNQLIASASFDQCVKVWS